MLELLSIDSNVLSEKNSSKNKKFPMLKQAFFDAGKILKAIDASIYSVIVPFIAKKEHIENARSKQLLSILMSTNLDCSEETYTSVLREVQQYSVNVCPKIWKKLLEDGAIQPIQTNSSIYYLDENYFHVDFGLIIER